MSETRKLDFAEGRLVLRSSLSPPTVRTVMVCSYAYEEDDGWHTKTILYPVMAVKSIVYRDYTKIVPPGDRPPVFPGTHRLAMEGGWRVLLRSEETRLVVLLPEENRLDDWPGGTLLHDGAGTTPVLCHWPEEEDRDRLADLIRKQESEALAADKREASQPPQK
jgi:hypothetical protein